MSPRLVRALATVAGTVPLVYVALTFVLGVAREGYDPVRDTQSELGAVDAPLGWAMNAGFALLGVGILAFAPAFAATFGARPRWLVPALVCVAGAGMVAVAFAPCDAGCVDVTATGRLHGLLSMPAALALPLAAMVAARPLAIDGRMGRAWPVASFAIGALSLASGPVVGLDLLPVGAGLLQRAGMWIALAWMSALAWRIRALHPRRRPRPPAGDGASGAAPGVSPPR